MIIQSRTFKLHDNPKYKFFAKIHKKIITKYFFEKYFYKLHDIPKCNFENT